MKLDRRESLRKFGAFVAGSPLAQGEALVQGEPGGGAPPSDRRAPVLELVNVPEFEEQARLVLAPARFEAIGGGHRTSFDKMTFRQRLMVYAMDLDLTTSLYGYDMFAPIIVGPVGNQGDIHPEGELATARGASAGKAVMVATRQSSHPIEEIVAASDEPVWYQLYADSGELGDDAARAVDAGCRAVCVTVGVSSSDHRSTSTDACSPRARRAPRRTTAGRSICSASTVRPRRSTTGAVGRTSPRASSSAAKCRSAAT